MSPRRAININTRTIARFKQCNPSSPCQMGQLSFVLLMSMFAISVIAYGDLSKGLPRNFCQNMCQSQKSHQNYGEPLFKGLF